MKFAISIITGLLFLSGCSSSPQKEYEKIPLGSEKGQVLHVLGNPNRTYRKNSVDRWVYNFRGEDEAHNPMKYEKEIWFENGKVVYRDKSGNYTPLEKKQIGPKDSDFVPIN